MFGQCYNCFFFFSLFSSISRFGSSEIVFPRESLQAFSGRLLASVNRHIVELLLSACTRDGRQAIIASCDWMPAYLIVAEDKAASEESNNHSFLPLILFWELLLH